MAAEIRLSYTEASPKFQITSSAAAAYYLKEIWDEELLPIQEQFYAVYLNNQCEVVAWRCLNTGTIKWVELDVKLLFSIGAAWPLSF